MFFDQLFFGQLQMQACIQCEKPTQIYLLLIMYNIVNQRDFLNSMLGHKFLAISNKKTTTQCKMESPVQAKISEDK